MFNLSPTQIRHSVQVGLSFGVTSGVITTVGLLVGLYSGTHAQQAVVAGILTIAVSDALSDAMGIHLAEESENIHSSAEIWLATVTTFAAKFCIAASFLVPFALTTLAEAVVVSLVWGLALLVGFNIALARQQRRAYLPILVEHLAFAVAVVALAYGAGRLISHIIV